MNRLDRTRLFNLSRTLGDFSGQLYASHLSLGGDVEESAGVSD
jgi:hypothetical protein